MAGTSSPDLHLFILLRLLLLLLFLRLPCYSSSSLESFTSSQKLSGFQDPPKIK
jgi:hypothetical protein